MNDRHYDLSPEDAERLFPLISAWGTAVEEGRGAGAELQNLRSAWTENPAAMREALALAKSFQGAQIKIAQSNTALDASSPDHPQQRLLRVQLLTDMLENEDLTL